MEIFITGIGWVFKKSMGYNGCIKKFDQNITLPKIERKDILNQPFKHFGRMDDFSKQGFAAIVFAMKDAEMKVEPEITESGKINPEKRNISIIASTVTGCLQTDTDFQESMLRPLPSPTVFAYTLDSSFLGEASIYLGLTGESFIVNEQNPDGLKGLFMALEIIESGTCDTVICGTCNSDIKINNTYYGTNTLGALFFVLQKKCLHSYGKIKSNSLEKYYYQDEIKINSLHDLAQKCNIRKKVTSPKKKIAGNYEH